MFCMNCGAQLLDGQAFCDKCGAPQPVDEPAAAQPVAEPVVEPVVAAQPVAEPVAQPVAQPVQPEPVAYAQPVAAEPVIDAQAEPKGNGAAVVGLVFGILAILLGWIPVLGWIFILVGLICSIVGLVKVKKVHKGKGPAIAGLITSILSIVTSVILFFAVVIVYGSALYIERAQDASASIAAHNAEVEVQEEIERVLS